MDNIYENRMFAVGKAWHDKGIRVDKEVTSAEAIKLAKLDYEIKKVDLFTKEGVKAEGFLGNMNTQNNKVLGIVSDRYKIVQNVEAFSFFDNIVKSGEAFYHSAGALGNGERIWLLAKLPQNLMVFKDIDIVEKYLLLTNCHDGKGSLLMYFTPIRVVCQNTLIASYKDSKDGISIRHMGDIKTKTDGARIALGFALDFYKDFDKQALSMVNTNMNIEGAREYFNRVCNINEAEKELSTQAENTRSRLLQLFREGKGNSIDGVKDTVWAGYNAVTEYADFHKTIKGDNRIQSILFGSAADLKRRAFQEAMVLIK